MDETTVKQSSDDGKIKKPRAALKLRDAAGPAATFRSPVGCTRANPGVEYFIAWCREERVHFPSSHISVLPCTGRALVASRFIKMGKQLAFGRETATSVPKTRLLRTMSEYQLIPFAYVI